MNGAISFIFVTAVAALATYVYSSLIKNWVGKHPITISHYRIHHSVVGAGFILAGLSWTSARLLAIGIGIYISHVIEEDLWNKHGLPRAMLVFVSKVDH